MAKTRQAKLEAGEANFLVEFADSNSDEGSTRSDSEDAPPRPCHACGASLPGDAAFCLQCGEKQRLKGGKLSRPKWLCGCCCGCCAVISLILVLAVVALVIYLNAFLKFAIESVGGAMLGVRVGLDSVDLNLFAGRVSVMQLDVDSPEGFQGRFIELGSFVFDVSPASLLSGWLSGFTSPVELEELTLQDVAISIDMRALPSVESNAQRIVDHMNEVVQRVAPQLATPLPQLSTDQVINGGLKAMTAKIIVDRIVLGNITASITLEPLGAISYRLATIQITDVGKKNNGVYLYEFIEILVRSILMSVIKAAPLNVRSNLARAFGANLWRELDFAALNFDAGSGLEKITEFTGWAAAEAAMLPLRMAEVGAKLTGEALSAGTKINSEFLGAGAKLTGLGVRAQTAIANAEVRAGVDAAEAGIKASEALAKLGMSFTNGFAQAVR